MTVLQGYGATETGTGTCTTLHDHGPGTVGRAPEGIEMRIVESGEIQFRGRTVFGGYWNAPELTAAGLHRGRLVPDRRPRPPRRGRPARAQRPDQGHHRAAQWLQRVPRGHRERPAGRRPARRDRGRDAHPGGSRRSSSGSRARSPTRCANGWTAAVKAANATLGPNQRVAGWRLWPDRGLPAHPHAQDQARPDPPLGGRRRAAARQRGRRRGRLTLRPGSAPRPRASRAPAGSPSCRSSSTPVGDPRVEHHRRADEAHDVAGPNADWTRAGPRRGSRPAPMPPRRPWPDPGTRRRR